MWGNAFDLKSLTAERFKKGRDENFPYLETEVGALEIWRNPVPGKKPRWLGYPFGPEAAVPLALPPPPCTHCRARSWQGKGLQPACQCWWPCLEGQVMEQRSQGCKQGESSALGQWPHNLVRALGSLTNKTTQMATAHRLPSVVLLGTGKVWS